MEIKIVLGWAFGDEGKGATTQWLVKKAKDEGKAVKVCRFSGGPQSAHTVKKDGITHICSSFGSGVLYGADTIYIGGYFDPICFVNECKELERKGVSIPNIYLSPRVMFITPYDVVANQTSKKEMRDGTCGRGIYRTFDRYGKRYATPNPMYNSTSELKDILRKVGMEYENPDRELGDMFIDACESSYFQSHVHKESDYTLFPYTTIFEGTQGLLLDMDFGFYPNVTPSNTGLRGIPRGALYGNKEVYLVTRTYLTRHGNGYEPKEPLSIENEHETNVCNEWQGKFKTGKLEPQLLEAAINRHCLDNYQKRYGVGFNAVFTCNDIVDMKDSYREVLSRISLPIDNVYASYNPYSNFVKWDI